MKTKTNIYLVVIIVFAGILAGIWTFVRLKPDISELTNLKLDQGNAYISISSNDVSGYNRWLPFYFQVEGNNNLSERDVEAALKEKISSISLFSIKDEELYETEKLIWSACKIDDNVYNLTLVLIPEIESIDIDGIVQISKIILISKDNIKHEYILDCYLVEEKETIPEDEMYVSLSSIEATVQEDLTSQINYGIMQNKDRIMGFDIYYPKKFRDIVSYEIVQTDCVEENTVEYTVAVRLKEKDSKTVFRPFLKIKYDDKIGWMIPSVPAYFK